jgi:hypothetical protein
MHGMYLCPCAQKQSHDASHRRLERTRIDYGVHIYRQRNPFSSHDELTLTVWSTLPVAITLILLGSASFPSAPGAPPPMTARPHAIHVTKCPCASIVFTHRPWARSQTRIVLSSATERRYFPDGWKTSARIQLSWPAYHQSCAVMNGAAAHKCPQTLATGCLPYPDRLVS